MKKLHSIAVIVAAAVAFCTATSFAQITRYVVTNDDNFSNNSATFYTIGAGGALTQAAVVPTGGFGLGGGYFASPRVTILRSKGCIYISNAGDNPGTVSGIVESTQTLAGTFKGSAGDNGDGLGIGMAVGNGKLYAGFTGSATIGTFRLLSGCQMRFVRDTPASGIGGGAIDGMKAHGNILVVAYADGSIESFNIASGVPVSNGDKQFSTGFNQGFGVPAGVDISQDGHWAIFGDAAGTPTVEVSDISSGKLATTVAYQVGSGSNSNSVLLSPDQTLLYISNNASGQVTAAFFDNATGVVSNGCMSGVLRNFNSTWFFASGIANATTAGTGRVLYVAEWGGGNASGIGIVKITSNGTSCSLTEARSSPASDPQSPGLLSLGVFPPRNFD
jgi:6-phosphogluconolactonase (cycloisomerase 2 family)